MPATLAQFQSPALYWTVPQTFRDENLSTVQALQGQFTDRGSCVNISDTPCLQSGLPVLRECFRSMAIRAYCSISSAKN